MSRCDCEHEDHFASLRWVHAYNVAVVQTNKVKTPYGTFNICEDCCARSHCGGAACH